MSINERVQSLIEAEFKGNKSLFASTIGVRPTVVENVVGKRQGKPSYDVIEKICANANVSPKWLLTGEGEMLNDAPPKNTASKIDLNSIIDKSSSNRAIPLVTQQAAAGFGTGHFSISQEDVKDYYVIPKFKHSKVDFMIEVLGDSMQPKYYSGDIIACSIISGSKFLQWNKPHVIATREQGILVKRIMPTESNDGIVVLSDNKEYKPFIVPYDEITGLALVVGVIHLE